MTAAASPCADEALAGVRVLECGDGVAAAYAAKLVADLGAEVVKVEPPAGDATRRRGPFPGSSPHPERSGLFLYLNANKRGIVLDLALAPDRVALDRLLARADLLITDLPRRRLEERGLAWHDVQRRHPRLVMTSITPFGLDGPHADLEATDLTLWAAGGIAYLNGAGPGGEALPPLKAFGQQASFQGGVHAAVASMGALLGPEREFVSYGPAQVPLSGLSSLTGYRGWPPMHVGISYGDPNGGIHGAFAVLAALWHRERTGEGQYIDLSQWETSMAVLPEGIMDAVMNGVAPERDGNRDLHMAPHGIFRAAGDDRWIALAVRNDDEWRRLTVLMDAPALADDVRFATLAARKANEDALEALVASFTIRHTPEDLTAHLQSTGLAASPAMTNRDLFEDPHLRARGFFVELAHPEVGVRRHLGIPWRMSGTPCAVTRAAPCLGEATEYVLDEILGYDRATRTDLRARGIVA